MGRQPLQPKHKKKKERKKNNEVLSQQVKGQPTKTMSMRAPRSSSSASRKHDNDPASSHTTIEWATKNFVDYAELQRSNEWRDRRQIGEGNSTVYQIRLHGNLVALKEFHGKVSEDRVKKEVKALLEISSTNVIGYRGILMERGVHIRGVFLELCQLNLCAHIQKLHETQIDARRLPFALEMQQIAILKDVACGLSAIHGHKFVHRDIKPANILLQTNGGVLVAKIADFETSRSGHGGGTKTTTSTTTEPYMAPEVLYNNEWSSSSDVWSFGLVAGQLFSNREPLASLLSENQSAKQYLINWLLLKEQGDVTGPADVYTPSHAAAAGMAVPEALQNLVVGPCLCREVQARLQSSELRRALDNAMGQMRQRLPRGPLYRVLYANQPAFDQGVFASNPHDSTVNLKEHVEKGSKRGSPPSRYVSTTTSFEWAIYYAVRQYTLSGCVDNPFIVEIDPSCLRQHLAIEHEGGHVTCFCVNNREDAERNEISSTMAQNFATSAHEVCFCSRDPKLPAIPRDAIVQVYQLPLQRDQKRPDKYRCRPGARNNRQLHPLQIKASERQSYVYAGRYLCRKFESFAAWFKEYKQAFPEVQKLKNCMELSIEVGCELIQQRAKEVQAAVQSDSTATVCELVTTLKELAVSELKDRLAQSGCPVPGRRANRVDVEVLLAGVLWREACFWRERWPRNGGYSSRWGIEESQTLRESRTRNKQLRQELQKLRASSTHKNRDFEHRRRQFKLELQVSHTNNTRLKDKLSRAFRELETLRNELRAVRATSSAPKRIPSSGARKDKNGSSQRPKLRGPTSESSLSLRSGLTFDQMHHASKLPHSINSGDAGGNIHVAEESGQKERDLVNISKKDRLSGVLGAHVGEQGVHAMRAGSRTAQTRDTATSTPSPAPVATDTVKAGEAADVLAPAPKEKPLKADAREFVPTFAATRFMAPPLPRSPYMYNHAPAQQNYTHYYPPRPIFDETIAKQQYRVSVALNNGGRGRNNGVIHQHHHKVRTQPPITRTKPSSSTSAAVVAANGTKGS